MSAAEDFREEIGTRKFATVLADPPWRFQNKTGKVAPEHKRLARYPTLTFEEIEDLPVRDMVEETAPSLSLGAQRLTGGGLTGYETLGISVQNESDLVQGQTRRRPR